MPVDYGGQLKMFGTPGLGHNSPDMSKTKILVQTTIPYQEDNWHAGRFSLLTNYLAGLRDASGQPLTEVVARNRESDSEGNDRLLSKIDESDFDQIWLFGVDTGDGLGPQDCPAIGRFRQRGGGVMVTRDHEDLGSSICELGGIGAAHFFHSHHQDPDTSRHCVDDTGTQGLSWPNYHSGRNGNYQEITPVEPLHDLLKRPDGSAIRYFPAHPHEGAVGVPAGDPNARVIATGVSLATKRPFNLVVALERSDGQPGRGVAQSTFHHFADYNWDLSTGAPSFVTDPEGDQIEREPGKMEDIKAYVANLVRWLTPPR